MKPLKSVIWLSWLIAALAMWATGVSLFWRTAGSPFTFTTLRGEIIALYGQGLYRYETVFNVGGFKGQDAVVLVLGVPILIILSTLYYRRGSVKGGLLLTGILAYFLYVYMSMVFNAAYNSLFLVYTALFSAGFFAFVLAFCSIDLKAILSPSQLNALPRRGPAIYMIVAGLLTMLVWLEPVISAMIQGRPPALLGASTTLVTYALDLAVITPATLVSGILIWLRNPLGYRIAFPLLGIIVMLGPTIVAGTILQLSLGVTFSPGEIIGPVSGFLTLGVLATWIIVTILRKIPNAGASATADAINF